MAARAQEKPFPSGRMLSGLLKELPTPFYLYDERGIRASIRELFDAFSWHSGGFMEYFPVSLAPSAALLKIFLEEGCGVYCDCAEELALARRVGFSDEQIVCSAFAGSRGLCVVLDGIYDLPPEPPAHALLRLNPGGKLLWGERPLVTLDRLRPGMPMQEMLTLASQLQMFGTQRVGLVFQGLCNDIRPEYYPAVAKLLFEAALAVHTKTGHLPESCCLGDGIGVPADPGEAPPSLSACGQTIESLFRALPDGCGFERMRLSAALGRRLLAQHAVFLTRVRTVKERRSPILVTDAASRQLPGCTQIGCRRHISLHTKGAPEPSMRYDVSVSQTEPYGYLAEGCLLPPVKAGDVLIVHRVGCIRTVEAQFSLCPSYLLREDGSVVPLEEI